MERCVSVAFRYCCNIRAIGGQRFTRFSRASFVRRRVLAGDGSWECLSSSVISFHRVVQSAWNRACLLCLIYVFGTVSLGAVAHRLYSFGFSNTWRTSVCLSCLVTSSMDGLGPDGLLSSSVFCNIEGMGRDGKVLRLFPSSNFGLLEFGRQGKGCVSSICICFRHFEGRSSSNTASLSLASFLYE